MKTLKEINKKKELLLRVYIVMVFVIITAILLFGKAVKINVFEGERWRAKGDSLYVKFMPIVADRGNILDDDGSLLATSLPFFDIRMDLKADGLTAEIFKKQVDSLSLCLSKFVNPSWTSSRYKNHLIKSRAKGERYLLIARNLNYEQLERLKRFPIFRLGPYKGGLIVERHGKRTMPYQMLANRTIGYVRTDVQVGLEGYFDSVLRGAEGKRLMQRVSGGTWIPVSNLTEIESKRGDDIQTTIDIELQDITHSALLAGLKRHNALYGTAIVMEVETGAIKAIANIGANNGGWSEDYNYAVGTSAEPGSTFKLASMMALLEDGYANLETRVDLEKGETKFFRETMWDSSPHNTEDTTLQYAFEVSSNVGIAKTVNAQYFEKKRSENFIKRLKQFHLNEKTGIEISGEGKPKIKEAWSSEDNWSGTTLPWMSTGYEVQITPLQTLNFYNAVANNGKMMKPYLVQKYLRDGKIEKEIKPKVIDHSIASDRTIQIAQDLLLGAVERGTGKKYKSDFYKFAGKTGTSRVDYFQKNINRKMYQASFVGYFPAEKPKYSCIVLIYDPKQAGYYGGSVALPIFREIADKCFAMKPEMANALNKKSDVEKIAQIYSSKNTGSKEDVEIILKYVKMPLEMQGEGEWATFVNEERPLLQNRNMVSGEVPDVRGMDLKDALFILENEGVQVKFAGKGKVKLQSIRPGTAVTSHTEVELTLG